MLDQLEIIFNVGIQVYSKNKSVDYRKDFAVLVKRPNPSIKNIMVLDLSQSDTGELHFKYVHDTKEYCRFFKCLNCGQLWNNKFLCERHEATCSVMTEHQYPHGYFQVRATIFEKMDAVGI